MANVDLVHSAKTIHFFWNHVQVCVHGLTCVQCCWLWTGGTSYTYGIVTIPERDQVVQRGQGPRTLGAHRLALEIAMNTRLPREVWALHRCNEPPCCNTNTGHIYAGTSAENARDRVQDKQLRRSRECFMALFSP
jgi:hypothetical protein